MAGNTPYSEPKLRALAEYLYDGLPPTMRTAECLAHACFQCDFDAYRRLGAAITGSVWRRGASTPYVAEAPTIFRDVVRERTPRWARAIGWLAVAYVVVTAPSVARRRLEDEIDRQTMRLLALFRVPGPLRREFTERQREELARSGVRVRSDP
jgi:hypothetical protein